LRPLRLRVRFLREPPSLGLFWRGALGISGFGTVEIGTVEIGTVELGTGGIGTGGIGLGTGGVGIETVGVGTGGLGTGGVTSELPNGHHQLPPLRLVFLLFVLAFVFIIIQ
jgi:hypothetical protein